MISLVIDTIIPGDVALGMPPASATNFEEYVDIFDKSELVERFSRGLQGVCKNRFESDFETLSSADRLNAINAYKNVDVRLFVEFISTLFRVYYSNPRVLQIISSGSVPPFPDGNVLEGDDWGILEPVFERGKIFRQVTSEKDL